MPLSGKKMLGLLLSQGWLLVRINGSHHVLVRGTQRVVVPVHGNKSLGKGLEQKILRQARLK